MAQSKKDEKKKKKKNKSFAFKGTFKWEEIYVHTKV